MVFNDSEPHEGIRAAAVENLGNIRHSDSPPIEQIQKEVLMEEGLFKQISEPIPFKGTDGKTWYYIDFIELGKQLN